ncbi:MAG: hypothetical protein M3Y04_01335 [Actinomycetota bacterium]|nr:hypothetical protein [Actinomycetota bacterium]
MSGAGPMPVDATSLDEIMATLECAGFAGQMAARPGAMILCFTCHEETPAAEVELEALGRTEGASDPADTLAVAGLTCPRCGARGTVVLGYGPEADPDDAEVLGTLGIHRA